MTYIFVGQKMFFSQATISVSGKYTLHFRFPIPIDTRRAPTTDWNDNFPRSLLRFQDFYYSHHPLFLYLYPPPHSLGADRRPSAFLSHNFLMKIANHKHRSDKSVDCRAVHRNVMALFFYFKIPLFFVPLILIG